MARGTLAALLSLALVLAGVPLGVLTSFASASGIVISEFRFRGPAGGNDEFVELVNASSAAVNISGWKLQGCSSTTGTASDRATIPAGVTLGSGQHYLFTNGASSFGYSGTVPGDQTYSTGISDGSGARIVNSALAVVDGVGGSGTAGTQCREGTGISGMPTANGDNSYERGAGGTLDTDNNATDFSGPKAGNPQNMGSTPPPPPPPVRIREIQGAGHISPKAGQNVSDVRGIVTVKRPSSIYIQDPDPDSDDATSEGILVFGTAATSAAHVGDLVSVSGRVVEFRPGGASTANLTTTEITTPGLSVTILSSGNPVPAATIIGSGGRTPPTTVIEDDATESVETSGAFDPASDGIDFWESLEAMLVTIDDAVAVGPTNDFGEIPLVSGTAPAGIRTSRDGIVIRDGDLNPERILTDDAIVFPAPTVNVGDLLGDVTGVLDYSFGNFKLLVTAAPTVTPGGLAREVTDAASDHEIAAATFNVENLDPLDGPAKFGELAELIVTNLRSPDLIALEEVQDDNGPINDSVTDASVTLATLVAAIQAAGGPVYEWRQIDPVDDQDGGEPGGNIRVAFLFRTDRGLSFIDRPGGGSTTATTVTDHPSGPQLSASPGRIDPTNAAFANSRKPLAGEFQMRGKKVFVVANHFNSKGGDQPLFGHFQPPTRSTETQRLQQATVVADFARDILALDPDANVIVLGDLNDFQFASTLLPLRDAGLTFLIDGLPESERYTYVFEGNSQALDHILVSENLGSHFEVEYDVVHVNAEFADQTSDHDPQVARLDLRGRPTPKTK